MLVVHSGNRRLVAITNHGTVYQWNCDTMQLILKVSILPLLQSAVAADALVKNIGDTIFDGLYFHAVSMDPMGRVMITIVCGHKASHANHLFVFDPQTRCWRHLQTPRSATFEIPLSRATLSRLIQSGRSNATPNAARGGSDTARTYEYIAKM